MVELAANVYPGPAQRTALVDTTHANKEAVDFVQAFIAAKNSQDVKATMAFVSPDFELYADVTLGLNFEGYDALYQVWDQFMPSWGDGLSYPTRIVGELQNGTGSIVIAFTDTPELFGGEMRITGSVDVRSGKITRWADYWDSAAVSNEAYNALKQPEPKIPLALSATPPHAASNIIEASKALAGALAGGDAVAAANLFSYDGIFEDVALNIRVVGRNAIHRYLKRVSGVAPFGKSIQLGHIGGGNLGGGFEWGVSHGFGVRNGTSMIELDSELSITRATFTYDSRNMSYQDRTSLLGLAIDQFTI